MSGRCRKRWSGSGRSRSRNGAGSGRYRNRLGCSVAGLSSGSALATLITAEHRTGCTPDRPEGPGEVSTPGPGATTDQTLLVKANLEAHSEQSQEAP